MIKCIICGNSDLDLKETIVSDFIMARIDPRFITKDITNIKTHLCFCKRCTFAFYEYRISDEESDRIYKNYRDDEYQKLREKYECWYTSKINDALNNDTTSLHEEKSRIYHMIKKNIHGEIRVALDYGGNEGKTFFKSLGTEAKYVYDISGVETIHGVKKISDRKEIGQHSYDFIMSNMLFEHLADPVQMLDYFYTLGNSGTYYYIEVPSENPFVKGNKFGIFKNIPLLFNPNYSNIKLAKYYFYQKTQPPMPMKEHINFFTSRSMKYLAARCNFEIIDIREDDVLSVLMKKSERKRGNEK